MGIRSLGVKLLLSDETDRFYKMHKKLENGCKKPLKWFYIWRLHRLYRRCGAWVGTDTQFADKPYFPHGLAGVFISNGAKIGSGCTIFHHVTIGSNNLVEGTKHSGAPTIGNNCFIGTGVNIIGGITIGDNVKIGAGCTVVEDVPDDATVLMPKAHVIVKEKAMTH